jgi:hypothetical protein
MAPINGFVTRSVNGFFLGFDESPGDAAVLREVANLDPQRCHAMSEAAQSEAKLHDWESVARRFSEHYAQALVSPRRGAEPAPGSASPRSGNLSD